MDEVWKPVVGYEGWYSVSSQGRVRRDKGGIRGARVGRILRPQLFGQSRYPGVVLARSADDHTPRYVHDLVAAAFIGPKPAGLEVNHKDTDKNNSRADNLEYETPKGNMNHAVRAGAIPTGEDSPLAKLSNADVAAIRARLDMGDVSQRVLADEYGVTQTLISRIKLRKTRKNG